MHTGSTHGSSVYLIKYVLVSFVCYWSVRLLLGFWLLYFGDNILND